jgi:hypothetical protein
MIKSAETGRPPGFGALDQPAHHNRDIAGAASLAA